MGNRYFIKNNNEIEIIKLENVITNFMLPTFLDKTKFSSDIEPLYVLPAIELQKERN